MTEEKKLLSIGEANQRYGIGVNRLRAIVKDDHECRYHLMVGRVIKIKRDAFDQLVNMVQEL